MPEMTKLITVTLPSGNLAVYEPAAPAGEFTGPAATAPVREAERARLFGRQVAHEWNGVWFKPGGWVPTVDPRGAL
jgi:hypothetical protein